jgi:hypothetical protein
MRKAKIILSAIAILAVIGGALAFKASSSRQLNPFHSTRTFTTTTIVGGPTVTLTFCDVQFYTTYTTATIAGVIPTILSYSTARTTTTCPPLVLYPTN